jgi:hypothetical protein
MTLRSSKKMRSTVSAVLASSIGVGAIDDSEGAGGTELMWSGDSVMRPPGEMPDASDALVSSR